MNSSEKKVVFAAVGDVHGHMHAMVRTLSAWEIKAKRRIDFVLQVGDFEAHRNEDDLATMAAPSKYRRLGDFHDFHENRARFPWPVYFIGGNHEPYGLLDTMVNGGEVCPNCFYLGRAGAVTLNGLRIGGLSGIYVEEFLEGRPSVDEIHSRSNKDYVGFCKQDIDLIAEYGSLDVLILHEWPSGIIAPADEAEFEAQRRSMRYSDVGNEYSRLVMDLTGPELVLCGHMHKAYRNTVQLPGGKECFVCCLANVSQGKSAFAVFERDFESIKEIML